MSKSKVRWAKARMLKQGADRARVWGKVEDFREVTASTC